MKKLKWISLILSAVVVFISILGCSSKPKTYTHGDWVIVHQGENECLIYDVSKQGYEKEVLIFPTEVDGRKVVGTYYEPTGFIVAGHQITAPNLRRLYFTEYVEFDSLSISMYDETHEERKVFMIYDLKTIENETNGYLDVSNFTKTTYIHYAKNNIPYMEISTTILPANVSYYYNYENAPFDGFYWLDDYDNEIIKYPPIDPVREGYEFAGWYKEPECINKWNFETDIVPTKEYTPGYPIGNSKKDKENYVYKETALYAKWVKI